MIYTVLTYHEDSRQIAAHHVDALDGQEAMYKTAMEHGGELVVAIEGKKEEGPEGGLTFPGDGLVGAQSYIDTVDEVDEED